MFSAPCGFGKTTVVKELLSKQNVWQLNISESEFCLEDIPKKCNVVLIDDLQYLLVREQQQSLCELIRSRRDLHFVFLGRVGVPSWLMPFHLAGAVFVIDESKLVFDYLTMQKILESKCSQLSDKQKDRIIKLTEGYPLALSILCNRLKSGVEYSEDIINKSEFDLFLYYEEAVYLRFEAPVRSFLLSIAPFESFSLEFAKMVSGDSRAGEFLSIIHRNTKMFSFDQTHTYHIWPIFQSFLLWESKQRLSDVERNMLYSRAALYYELNEDLGKALEFYTLSGDKNEIFRLLVKNTEKNPSMGNYREMKNHYFGLPREDVLKNPSLISGMSLLTALCMDYEASENWYEELQKYFDQLKVCDSEYKTVQAKLIYLDIALPQHGSKKLVPIINKIYGLFLDKQLKMPSISVTCMLPSIINGGKDFSEWFQKEESIFEIMKKPLEAILGKGGIGVIDCAICEGRFAKGEDISKELLTLMSRLGEIQVRGTAETEFAVIGLLVNVQISQGKARPALESLQSLRNKFHNAGEIKILENVDAMLCRINLYLGDKESSQRWLQEKAPKNEVEIWTLWRYKYITRTMVQISKGEYQEALILLARLLPYCEHCDRVMDSIYIRILKSICYKGMDDKSWEEELNIALDSSYEYRFIWPIAQYGVAILPLLVKSSWNKDSVYLNELIAATRVQGTQYPKFLKSKSHLVKLLSEAEVYVLKLLCENLTNQEIGDILGIKLSTVKSHVSRILQKLDVNRRSEAKAVAEELDLLR